MAQYIPILRWKRGERTALQALSANGRTGVTPLLVIGPNQFVSTAETSNRPAITAADRFAQEVLTAWGSAPFFVDASALGASQATGVQAIVAIATSARNAGLHLIPAASFSSSTAYFHALSQVAAQDGHGVGLRADLSEFTNASSWASSWLRPLNETDLIADFSDNVGHVAALGGTLTSAFINLHLSTSWRSVTLTGTSMPPTFQGYPQGVQTIPRVEWMLWQSLSAAVTQYDLHYGDYATVSPNAPAPPGAVGFPINAKYTLDREFLICRGVRPNGPNGQPQGVQLLGHAQTIHRYPNRGAIAHCWADTTIDQIVTGASPGNPEKWVRIAVNRHIELVRDRLP